MSILLVGQKEWAFTSTDSKQPKIQTSAFGPCYVVTFTSGKFAAMTHMDDTTQVDAMKEIFKRFSNNSVELKDVKVIIMGGWKDHLESKKTGDKILTLIKKSGFINISTKQMFIKEVMPLSALTQDASKLVKYTHKGALVDAKTGKTFLTEPNIKDSPIFLKKAYELMNIINDMDPSIETPLREVSM